MSKKLLCLALFSLGLAQVGSAVAGLTITKSHVDENGGELCEGDTVLFTLRVVADSAEDFRINDTIPSSWYSFWEVVNTTGIACSTNVGALSSPGPSGMFCANRVMLGPGGSFDFRYRATVRANCSVRQTCQVASALDTMFGSYMSNSDCVDYTCNTCSAGSSDLLLTKAYTGTASPGVGDPVSWRITLTNQSAAIGDTNVRVTDVVDAVRIADPQFLNFSRTPTTLLPGPNLDATWSTFMPGETVTFDLVGVYANCTSGLQDPLCNQATVTSDILRVIEPDMVRMSHPPGDPQERPTCTIARPGGSAMLTTPVPKTVVDLNGPPTRQGDRVEYTIAFENTGWCPTALGSLTDDLDVDLTLDLGTVAVTPPANGVDNSAGNQVRIDQLVVPRRTQASPAQTRVTFQATVDLLEGRICNTGDWLFGVAMPQLTTEVCFDVGTDFAAVKSHSDPNRNGTLGRGQDLQYVVRIENVSTATLSDIRFVDNLPPGVTFVSLDATAGGTVVSAGPTTVEISMISVMPGAANAQEVRFTVREDGSQPAGDDICNTAAVSSMGTTLDAGPACVTVQDVTMVVTKSHSDPNGDGTLNRNQQLQYTITIENTSATPGFDFNVLDVLPPGVAFVSIDDSAGGVVVQMGPTVEVDAIPVLPGMANRKSVLITVVEDGSVMAGRDICNVATVSSGGVLATTDPPACVTVSDIVSCAAPPSRIVPLLAVKNRVAGSVDMEWPMEATSTLGYRAYSVPVKGEIPFADALGTMSTLECEALGVTTLMCSDADALSVPDPRLYYQLIGVCDDGSPIGTEGEH